MAYVNINVLAKKTLKEEERKKKRAAQTQQTQKTTSSDDLRSRTVNMNRERADKDSTYAPAGVSRKLYDAVREGIYTSAIANTQSRSIAPTPLPVFDKSAFAPSVSPLPTRTATPRAGGDTKKRVSSNQEKTWMEDVAERKAKFADTLTVQTDTERALGLPGTKPVTLNDYVTNPNLETYSAFDRATAFRQSTEEVTRKLNIPLQTVDGNNFGYISKEAYNAIANNKLDSYTPISKGEKKSLSNFKKYTLELLSKQQATEKEKRIQSNPVFARYNIDPNEFDLFDLDEWAKKHNYQEMIGGYDTYYTPKYEGGIIGIGEKKLTSRQEEEDFKVLLALAQNNSRKTVTDKDHGAAMAALLGFGDNFLFGAIPSLTNLRAKREYELAGLNPEDYIGSSQLQQKTQAENPISNFIGSVAGNLATTLALGKVVDAGVKSIKLFAKASPWVQQAVTDGITFGISNGTKTAFQGETIEGVLKSVARGGTSAAVGGALSAKADQLITSLLTNSKYADAFWGQIKDLIWTNAAKNTTVGLVDAIGDNVADATMAWATGTEPRSAEDILSDFTVTLIYGLVNTAIKTKGISQSNKAYIENELARYMNDYNALNTASMKVQSPDDFVEFGEAIMFRGNNLREFLQRNIFTGQKKLVDSILEKLNYINEAVGRKIDNVSRKTKTQTVTPQPLPVVGAKKKPIKVGRATIIRNPYTGKTPTKDASFVRDVLTISQEKIDNASKNYDDAENFDSRSFSGKLKEIYQKWFDKRKEGNIQNDISVKNVTFEGRPYIVSFNKSVIGKLASDANNKVEKWIVLEDIDNIVRNAEYVGSSAYVQKGNKHKETVRFDCFETDIKIGENNYVVTFDVEVFPSTNNYRTHRVINEMDLTLANSTDLGTAPSAPESSSSPIITIPQTPPSVNPENSNVVIPPIISPYVARKNDFDDTFVLHYESAKNDDESLSVKEQIKKYSDVLDSMQPVFDDEVYVENKGKTKNKEWILPLFEKLGFKIKRNDIGEISVDKKRISKSLSYLKTDGELAAYSALPYVLKNGKRLSGHSNHKQRGYGTETIIAPVVINGVRGNMGAVVRIDEEGNFYKVHRILMPDGSTFIYENNRTNAETAAATTDNDVVASPTDIDSTITIPQLEQSVNPQPLPIAVTQAQELPVVSDESVSNERALIKTDERIASEQRLKSELEDEALIGDGYTSIFTKLKTQLENTGRMVNDTTAFGDIYYIQKKSNGKYVAIVEGEGSGGFAPSELNKECDSFEEAYISCWEYIFGRNPDLYSTTVNSYLKDAGVVESEVVEFPIVQNEMQPQPLPIVKNEAQLNQGNDGIGKNDRADAELTYEGRGAILRYKSSDSYKINEKLYSGQELNKQEAKLVADINSTLDKLPVYQGKVYRNLSFDLKGQDVFDNFIRMHKKGGFVSYPAFTSTSKTPDGYVVDGELLVHIEIYSANGRDIENIGDKDEKEVLFKTDPLFIVKDIQFDGKEANIILEEDGYDRIRERHVLQHSSERSTAVRNLQESHTDDFNVQGVSRENPGRNNARQMGPQRALPGGQRDIVRTGGSELHSGGTVRQEQDRLNIEIDTDIDTELVQAVKEEDAKLAEVLTEKGVAYTKDFARNFDAMSGGNKKVRNWLAMLFERPFLDAKALYSTELKETLSKYYDSMKRLGIKKSSKESAAVQWYGEGVRMDQYGELHDYTLADLKREFPQTWKNVVAADLINRELYDGYIDQINAVLEQIYPHIMENAQYDLEFHQHEADMLRRQLDELRKENSNIEDVGGNSAIAEIDSNINAKQAEYNSLKRKDTKRAAELLTQIERMKNRRDKITAEAAIRKSKIERSRFSAQRSIEVLEHKIAQHEAEAARLEEGIRTGSIMKNKRLNKRKDYYHHFKEMSEGFMGLGNIFDVGHAIDPELVGTSDNTKPRTKWEGFMQRRLEGRYSADSVAGMLHYIPAALYKIHFDPVIAQNRRNIDMLKQATGDTKNANGAIEWLTDWTNGLAGKTNPVDRPIQKMIGRRAMKCVAWLNNRFKKNAIFGNVRTAISQFLNLPNGIAYVKNPRDLAKGVGRYVKNIFSKDSVINDSAFMRERYIESEFDKFDEGVLKTPEKFAKWMLTFGDKETAKLIWYSAYEQSMRKSDNHSDAVVYADDVTRRSIAGRGIGELPILLDSKAANLIAPFQVEANNTYQMIKEKIGKKDVWGLAAFVFSSWVLNNITDMLGLGRILPDVVDALASMFGSSDDEEKDLQTTVGEDFTRVTGELLSYLPFGTVLSGFLPEDFRSLFYGENDPTRYGTGNAGIAALAEPVVDVVQNGVFALPRAAWDVTTDLLMPWGGKQLDRTTQAAYEFGALPIFGERNAVPASYSDDGRLRYPIEPTVPNTMKAFVFGSSATEEGNAYFDKGTSPMSHKQTEVFKDLTADGVSGTDAFDLLKSLSDVDESSDASKTLQAKEKVRDARFLDKYQKEYVDSVLIPGKKANYENVDTFALSVAFPDESKREKAYQIASAGLPADRVMDIMNKLDNIESDTDEWGRSISGSKNKKSVEYVESLNLNSKQKAAVYKAYMFSDVDNRYNFLANQIGITDDVLGDIYGKLSTIESSKNSQGKTISGSQNRNVYNYINTLSLSGEQRRLLFAWFASSTNEQKKQRYNVINNLNISQGDKETVLQWLQGNKTISDTHIKKIFNRTKKQ